MRPHRLPCAAVALVLGLACSFCLAQDAKSWEKPGTKVGDETVGPDGAKMVWVPAGTFDMGAEDLYGAKPVHHVHFSKGFWLGKCTVTNAQYRKYCQATGTQFPEKSDQGDDHPVVCVNWADAAAYCKHYGLVLPTEAQWEYAARGPEGRTFPWGDTWDDAKCCNKANKGPKGRTFAVGGFPDGVSWCGALDMAGSVCVWCNDWFAAKYYEVSPADDPKGPAVGDPLFGGPDRVNRGGEWCGDAQYCRSAFRNCNAPAERSVAEGFRCVKTP